MFYSKREECSETETQSRMSRFAIVPILRGKTNSVVSDRIITALRKSSFCSSNPVIKKLIIQNVHVWCIVIETSGTQSVKVICASFPYVLKLLSRANPKLKQILQDEKVASYLKFFQETDLESLLSSVCTATVIIQKGIQMCQPTLCVQLSRDALMFGNVTLKAFLNMLYDGLMSTFQFLWEDLGPAFRSFCSRNRVFVKYIAKNLPVFALAAAKSLVLFSFFVRRMLHFAVRTIKRFVKYLYNLLQELSVDYYLVKIFESLTIALKSLTTFMLSDTLYQYCKCICISSGKLCIECAKRVVPVLCEETLNFINGITPFLKKCTRFAIQSSASGALLLEQNIIRFIKFCYNSKPILEQILLTIKPYITELLQLILSLATHVIQIGRFTWPHLKKLAIYTLKNIVHSCVNLFQGIILIFNYISKRVKNIPKIYPLLKYYLNNANYVFIYLSKCIIRLCKVIFISLQNIVPTLYFNVQPLLLPIGYEMHSFMKISSDEIITKAYSGMRRVVPSLWHSFRIVSPPTFHATQEIFVTSKKAFTVVCPTLLEAIVIIRPEIFKGIIVVFKDGNKAFLEIVTVSYAASGQLRQVAKNVSKQMPVVLHAVNEVTEGTVSAITEVSKTSNRAQERMLKDFKIAVLIVKSSLSSAEVELLAIRDEIVFVINDNISDALNLQDFINSILKGCVTLSSSFLNNLARVLYITFSYSYFVVQKLIQQFFKYLSYSVLNSSNVNSILKMILSSLFISSNILCSYITNILNIVLKSKEFVSLSSACDNVKDFVIHYLFYICALMKQYACIACSELVHNICPKLWNFLKCAISTLWYSVCNLTNESWIIFEKLSARMWCFIYENFPELWEVFKDLSEIAWKKACKYSPGVWDCTLTTIPIMWSSNCYMVKSLWNLYVEACSQTWNHTVPFYSNTWVYAVDNCPKLWFTVSENSKNQWKLFCYAAENSWVSVTDTSSMSWELFNKIVSKSWYLGIRPVTIYVCCNTSTMLVKSLKISYCICTKTGEICYFLYEELSGKKIPLINFDLISSKLEENATKSHEIFKKCIDFTSTKMLKTGTKRKWIHSAIKNIVKIPSQMSETYGNFLKLGKVVDNVCAISKISFLPVSNSYALGHDLFKKYYSIFSLLKNVYFPRDEIFPVLTANFHVE